MKVDKIYELMEEGKTNSLKFTGTCADCGEDIAVVINCVKEGFEITGGAVYSVEEEYIGRCNDCFTKEKTLKNYQECEVYSRVVGYLRPVSQWNPGKQAEFRDRVMLKDKG